MSYFCCHSFPYFGFLVMSPLGFKTKVGSTLFALKRWMQCMFPETSGSTYCQLLGSQHCEDSNLRLPTLPPTGKLPKPQLGIKPQPYAQESFTLTTMQYQLAFCSLNLVQPIYLVWLRN